YGAAPQAARKRFAWRKQDERAARPPLTYFDDETRMFPTHPCVGFLYGKQGSHKTGLLIKLGLDAIEQKGARVLYLAQEGAYGFDVARMPAAREARGMEWATVRENWASEDNTFSLLRPEDHIALAEAYKEFSPTIIFVDVLSKVTIGADLSTPEGGQAVMN